MRPPFILAALTALAVATAVRAQPGPAHPGGFMGGAAAAGHPVPHPGFGPMHPGHFRRPIGMGAPTFRIFASPFGVVAPPDRFFRGYSPGFYGYAGGYGWPWYIDEDQPPPPLVIYEPTAPAPAGPARWGSSTLEFAPAAADARSAVITVRLPADAVLYVQGEKQTTTDATRQVVTPPLERGRAYDYDLRAVWSRDGRPVERQMRLTVRAGDRQSITFPAEPPE